MSIMGSGAGYIRRAPSPKLVDGMPVLKPLRVPSRFGPNGSRPGSAASTPRGTPRSVYRPAKRRRRMLLAFQMALLGLVGLLVFRHTAEFNSTTQYDAQGPPRKRQLIADAADLNRKDASILSLPTDVQQQAQAQQYLEQQQQQNSDSNDQLEQGRQAEVEQLEQQQQQPQIIDKPQQNQLETDQQQQHKEEEQPAAQKKQAGKQTQSLKEALLDNQSSNGGVSMFPGDSSVSEVFAHPTAEYGGDEPTSYFYRFTNVRIGEGGAIDFYGGSGMVPPKKMVYDVVEGNNSSPQAPTDLLLTNTSGPARTIPIRYLAQKRSKAKCARYLENPTFLLHVDSPEEMWTMWTQGLMPTFQTLRELGYLPLMEVTAEKTVTDVKAGVAVGECPSVADPGTGALRQAADCSQSRPAPNQNFAESCNSTDTWCIKGVWPHAAYLRTPHPIMMYSSEAVMENSWGALFSAMAGGGVREWNGEEGTCLRNLIVGYSRTLSVGKPVPSGGESGVASEQQERMAAALDVFCSFMRSAFYRLNINNAVDTPRYTLRAAQRLRRGLVLGMGRNIDTTFRAYKAIEAAGGPESPLYEDWDRLRNITWLFDDSNDVWPSDEDESPFSDEAAEAASPSPLGPPSDYQYEPPRPTVTYISRWNNLTGAILNDRQMLRYIYWRYNVTLRVTTLEENEVSTAIFFSTTDVLIAPSSINWSSAVFLKPGAVSLQLLPYGHRLADGSLLRGNEVASLVHLRRGTHVNWVNPYPNYSYFRMFDFSDDPDSFVEHPSPLEDGGEWASPAPDDPHPAWLNCNTYADMAHLGPYIDEVMRLAGIEKLDPKQVASIAVKEEQTELASVAARQQAQMLENLQAEGDDFDGEGEDIEGDEEEDEEFFDEEEEGEAEAEQEWPGAKSVLQAAQMTSSRKRRL